jgi:hypothetical protein
MALRISMFHTLAFEGRTSSEVYAAELGRALRTAGVEVVDVWPPTKRRRATRRMTLARRYLDRYVWYQVSARRAGSQVNHIPDHGYGHLAFSLDPSRTVVTFHDAMLLKLRARELRPGRLPWATITGHNLSLRAIRRVARVITDSASARDDFLRFQDYPPERVVTIPLAVSPSFHPLTGRRDDPHGDPGILHVQQRLGRPVRFRKVGSDFTTAQQELIGSLGIAGSIDHLGTLSNDQLPRAYADSDILVMPSLHEGFGLPILEAMASGIPVVASNRGSLPEVIGDAGLMVEPDDIEAIVGAVVRLLTDPLLRDEMTARGIKRARQFTWNRTARATLDVYRAICAEAG